MKKSILAVAVVLGATSTFAQDLTSRKGENYLPEAGDWAIGINAVPLLNYVGNIFGKGADNMHASTIWNSNNPAFTINGKYFVEDGMAYRGGIRLGFGSTKEKTMVADRSIDPSLPSTWPTAAAEVENTWKHGNTNVGLTFGMEWRKGHTRLQGYYGAEIGFMIASSKDVYTYGNALTPSTSTVVVDVTTADDFGGNLSTTTDGMGMMQDTRITESKNGLTFGLGLRGFIGAEYFIIPKLAIGGELGWGLGLVMGGKSTVTSEGSGFKDSATDESVETMTMETGKTTTFGVDNSIVNPMFGPVGRLNLTFHF